MWRTLRDHAQRIWWRGVQATRGDIAVARHVNWDGGTLWLGGRRVPLSSLERIVVVGAGKAAAAMAAGFEATLGEDVLLRRTFGRVNVPEPGENRGNSPHAAMRPQRIELHAVRAAGRNAPTLEAVAGTGQIRRLIEQTSPRDVVLSLLSGGASALLVSPTPPVTLDDKIRLADELPAAGAGIHELNAVRAEISEVKGGRLPQRSGTTRWTSLILSDVLDDDLSVIGSGPTFPRLSQPDRALQILHDFGVGSSFPHIVALLNSRCRGESSRAQSPPVPGGGGTHVIVGNLEHALRAAAEEATWMGYQTRVLPVVPHGETVQSAAQQLFHEWQEARWPARPVCILGGGEPTVRLPPSGDRGKGGRNQQLALELLELIRGHASQTARPAFADPGQPLAEDRQSMRPDRWVVLSAASDGEDGPTDAAGAFVDDEAIRRLEHAGLDAERHRLRYDGYPLFAQIGSLFQTGFTQSNVCDLRVLLWYPDGAD